MDCKPNRRGSRGLILERTNKNIFEAVLVKKFLVCLTRIRADFYLVKNDQVYILTKNIGLALLLSKQAE